MRHRRCNATAEAIACHSDVQWALQHHGISSSVRAPAAANYEACEQSIIPARSVLGRKNWLVAGWTPLAKAAAIYISIETARRLASIPRPISAMCLNASSTIR